MDLASLRADIIFYLHRTDLTDAQVDGFIDRAMERVSQTLYPPNAELFIIWNESAPDLPADLAAIRSVTQNGRELKPLSAIEASRWTGSSDTTIGYTLSGAVMTLVPSSPIDCLITYYSKPAPLTGAVTTNWVTDNYQNLALYGSLVEAARWERDTESVQLFDGQFIEAMTTAQVQADKARYGAAPVAASHYQAPTQISQSM